jgi:tetratricopeptide (TPR) repeat protein
MGRIWLTILTGLVLGNATLAADADLAKPYEYRIILRIAPHRLLTPTFRRRLRDELQDGVQAALGSLAQVDVVEADAKDWLDPTTLDSHSEVTAAKRHFVDVAFADGRYVVRARQLDGSTGLASPVVREARTPDRPFVGRLITRFIDQDFGAVGTVVDFDKATDRAVLEFRGGSLAPAELSRLVPTGSVFALARIEGSPPRGRPVDAAYLVTLAEPKDGRCNARFVYRYQDQLASWSAVTFRALKLGTAQCPIHLRLVDKDGLPPQGLQVRISPDGFRSRDVRDQGATRDGAFDSAHNYERLAYVVISAGNALVAQIPVPVIDDRVTTCPVTLAAGGEARQQLEMAAANMQQRFFDIGRRLAAQSERLGELIRAQRNREALDDVNRSLDTLDRELNVLTLELARLRRDPGLDGSIAGRLLDQCDVFAQGIRKRRDILNDWHKKLDDAIADERKQEPQRAGYLSMLHRADTQEEAAEFDEALKTYDEMLAKFGKRDEIRSRRDKLEKGWKIQSDEHRHAREFIYGAWSKVRTVDDIRANLPKAREALATLKQAGDRLTPLKILHGSDALPEILQKAVEEIKNSESEVDKLALPQLQQLKDDLLAFIKDVSAHVRPEKS